MNAVLHTALCDLLGCRYPIVQTAMGWVADARLVAAACNAGAFGFLAAATIPSARLEDEIRCLRDATDRPFGINFHMFQSNAIQVEELAIRYGARAVSYGRGPDRATIARFKRAGIVCMPTVGNVQHAVKAVALGADAIVVQGAEGGGHTGAVPSSILLPQVLDAVDVPVIAAGGYCDGRGLAGALACGAAGVAMGTRFLMTRESPVPASTLACYLNVGDTNGIRISRAIDGLPQQVIDTKALARLERAGALSRTWGTICCAWRWKREAEMTLLDWLRLALTSLLATGRTGVSARQALMAANAPVLIKRAMVDGAPDEGVLPSGQVAAVIDRLLTCAELVESIVAQAKSCIERLCDAAPPISHPLHPLRGTA